MVPISLTPNTSRAPESPTCYGVLSKNPIDAVRRAVLVPVAVDSPRRYTGAMNAIDERACGKPGCDNFGKPGLNIVGHGWFVTKSGRRRRYRCALVHNSRSRSIIALHPEIRGPA